MRRSDKIAALRDLDGADTSPALGVTAPASVAAVSEVTDAAAVVAAPAVVATVTEEDATAEPMDTDIGDAAMVAVESIVPAGPAELVQ